MTNRLMSTIERSLTVALVLIALLLAARNIHPVSHWMTRAAQPVLCPQGVLFEDWSCGK